jgi:glycosyltransferase involved in cell wall biosynthesis
MMRVAVVAPLVFPMLPAQANGPHSVVIDLCRGLSARGHEVTLYAAAGSTVDGVTVREIAVDPVARTAAARADGASHAEGRRALRDAFQLVYDDLRARPFDVISQHAFDAPAIELAEGMPVLHTLHLPPVDETVVGAARSTRAGLVAVSEASRRDWEAAGVASVGLIRNGVPFAAMHGKEIAEVDAVALIAGRISPEKGTAVALRVARQAGLKARVIGDVYDREYFEEAVAPLLQDDEFIGPRTRSQLSAEMERAAVLLMPVAWDEPFGLVAAEAQMAGCPVVGYRRGALPEIVPEGLGGHLVEPDDEAGLVEAIGRARSLDRAAIRQRAEKDLGVEPMVAAYEAALGDVARGGRAGLVG